MTYIHQPPVPHYCQPPQSDYRGPGRRHNAPTAPAGTIWQCRCGRRWFAKHDRWVPLRWWHRRAQRALRAKP